MLSYGDPEINQVVRPCLPGARSHRQRETDAVVKTGMASAARRNACLGGGGRYSDRYSLEHPRVCSVEEEGAAHARLGGAGGRLCLVAVPVNCVSHNAPLFY